MFWNALEWNILRKHFENTFLCVWKIICVRGLRDIFSRLDDGKNKGMLLIQSNPNNPNKHSTIACMQIYYKQSQTPEVWSEFNLERIQSSEKKKQMRSSNLQQLDVQTREMIKTLLRQLCHDWLMSVTSSRPFFPLFFQVLPFLYPSSFQPFCQSFVSLWQVLQ